MRKYSYRVRFAKRGDLRFLSHHDLMRQVEQALRRSELPVAFTEGFHPRVQLSFPFALGLGIDSDDEIFDLSLTNWVPPAEIQARLSGQMPHDLPIAKVEVQAPGKRYRVARVDYEVRAPAERLPDPERIRHVLGQAKVVVERRRKDETYPVDLRPYIIDMTRTDDGVCLGIRVTDEGTARPDEVLEALGVSREDQAGAVRIRKTRTYIADRT